MKKLTNTPTLADVFEAHRSEVFSNINCHAIGKIESFNAIEQTATISIQYQRRVENIPSTYKRLDYPNLVGVPLITLSGGPGSLRFPIKIGDECLVFFNDRDLDNWFTTSSKRPLSSDRKHSFSDAIALVGPKSVSNVLENYDTSRTELVHDQTFISLSDKIRIKNQTQNLFDIIDGLFTELAALVPTTGIPAANKVNIAALKVKFNLLMEQ